MNFLVKDIVRKRKQEDFLNVQQKVVLDVLDVADFEIAKKTGTERNLVLSKVQVFDEVRNINMFFQL